MNIKSIRWRLPISYAGIALLAALSLGSFMLLVLYNYYTRQERDYLLGNALSLQPMVEQVLLAGTPPESLQSMIEGLSFLSQTRIRVLDPHGKPLADSGVPRADQLVAITGDVVDGLIFSVPLEDQFQTGTVITPRQALLVPGVMTGITEEDELQTEIIVSASPFGYGFSTVPASNDPTQSTERSSQHVRLELAGALGSLEISDGPAYGRDILRSVGLAWAGAGIVAIGLAAVAGSFASRMMTRPVLALEAATRGMQAGDLTARVALQEKGPAEEFQALAGSFNAMAQRMQDTISTLRAFVADAAHELHTPLTALHTNLELAADEPDPTRRGIYLEQSQAQSRRLEALVGGLLDLSRIEAAGQVPEQSVLEINPLLQEMAESYAARAEQAGQSFTLDLPAETLKARADAGYLRRVLSNLLENALKFTPPGGRISVQLRAQDGQAQVQISDTGIGIPPEDLPQLFERFHRGRNTAAFPGSGLGLAIVRALVEAMGGWVKIESSIGAGTSVDLALPLAA